MELAFDAKVVTNPFVGFGEPLTVTVGMEESSVADALAEDVTSVALTIANRDDRQCMTPSVELRKRRK